MPTNRPGVKDLDTIKQRNAAIDVAAAALNATSGNYIGNSAANRAIPHGLGRVPKCIIIASNTAVEAFIIVRPGYINELSGGSALSVTAMDATNFYVGNSGNYTTSANLTTTTTYYWFAI